MNIDYQPNRIFQFAARENVHKRIRVASQAFYSDSVILLYPIDITCVKINHVEFQTLKVKNTCK